jgi:hypothetical protein
VTGNSRKFEEEYIDFLGKMMDIWMVGCISFVFGALAEFIVVKYLAWKKAQETKAAEDRKAEMEAYWAKISPRQGNEGQNETKRRLNVNNKDNPYLQFYNDLNAKEMMMMRDKVVENIQTEIELLIFLRLN